MVNNTIVSRFTDDPPTTESSAVSRRIKGGGLYDRAEILRMLEGKASEVVIPWTRKCGEHLQKFGMDHDDAACILKLCMQQGTFLGAEWCQQKPNGAWAACDAYKVNYREWNKAALKDFLIEYYVKFGIGRTGKILLVASCHPSGNWS
jgi:hypothetical protein